MTNTNVGEQLRTARLARNLELSEIAETTKISKFYLEALETNQMERLPGLFFYKAFVRQYARFLNLDPEVLERQISSQHGDAGPSIAEIRQTRKPGGQRGEALRAANSIRPDTRFMLASVGLIAVLTGGSFIYTWIQRPSDNPVPARTPVDTAAPPVAAKKQPSATTAPQPDQLPQSQQQASPSAGAIVQQVSDNLTPNAAPNSAVTLSLSAVEPTWLAISSDGKILYSGMLEPQQSKQLAGNSSVVIRVGNAAGLEVKWNGKAVGKLGDAKQVRTIMFTDKEFQILKPPPPAPSQPAAPVL